MKKNIFILVLIIPIVAGIIFTGYRSSAQKQKAVQPNLVIFSQALNTLQKPAEAEEWIRFRQESESKISDHEKRITDLKTEIKNNEEVFDAPYRKKVAVLAEQIRFIKARLENYDKSPGNWESFRHGINNDMDAIEKAFLELTAGSKE